MGIAIEGSSGRKEEALSRPSPVIQDNTLTAVAGDHHIAPRSRATAATVENPSSHSRHDRPFSQAHPPSVHWPQVKHQLRGQAGSKASAPVVAEHRCTESRCRQPPFGVTAPIALRIATVSSSSNMFSATNPPCKSHRRPRALRLFEPPNPDPSRDQHQGK